MHDEASADLLREAETITDDEERLVQFSTALRMETIELGFKVNAYLYDGGESPENKAFYKKKMQLIEETTDLMRQYHSDEEVEAVGALMVTDYCLNFDESNFDESCFGDDYRFGTEWNKKNINVDARWEMYLSSLTEWADQQPET